MLMKTLLYKPVCESCSGPLKRLHLFCAQCQADCYYLLMHPELFTEKKGSKTTLFLSQNPFMKHLYYLAQNPRSSFALDGLISMIVLFLTQSNITYPTRLKRTQVFKNKKLNLLFFKKLSSFFKLDEYPIFEGCDSAVHFETHAELYIQMRYSE